MRDGLERTFLFNGMQKVGYPEISADDFFTGPAGRVESMLHGEGDVYPGDPQQSRAVRMNYGGTSDLGGFTVYLYYYETEKDYHIYPAEIRSHNGGMLHTGYGQGPLPFGTDPDMELIFIGGSHSGYVMWLKGEEDFFVHAAISCEHIGF
uniref:Endo-arabinase n=1 Tax=Cytobacillus firmus TaxID=1399 RepID=Q71S34_CYTFI|nr:endo-arabinase [Cytobacillus firmus]